MVIPKPQANVWHPSVLTVFSVNKLHIQAELLYMQANCITFAVSFMAASVITFVLQGILFLKHKSLQC